MQFTINSKLHYFSLLSTELIKANNGDGKGVISSIAYFLLSIFHEPGKGFETFSIMKGELLVCFAKDTSSLLEKPVWPNLSECHAGVLIESFSCSGKFRV